MEELILIKTLEQLKELQITICDKDYIAFDTETTGVHKEAEIIGISVSVSTDIGYYVVLSYWDKELKKLVYLETCKGIKTFLRSLQGKSLIMHNGVFDCSMVYNNYSISLIESLHTDTMILAHLLDENRHNGLKELGTTIFGEDARKEQNLMKESVKANGGLLTKDHYELYKGDADLIGHYGAKDAILTLKLFYHLVPQLYEEGLDTFFYEIESMPLLKGPTYELNTTGLKVDLDALQKLKGSLEAECLELKAFIYKEITPHVQDKYPGTSKAKTFNIGAAQQMSWLLFDRLGNEFITLTEAGRTLCKTLNIKIPYAPKDKRQFIAIVKDNKGVTTSKKIGDYWKYLATDKNVLLKFSKKYQWVEKLLLLNKNNKLLSTYVEGIQSRVQYGVIHPSFLQHGTTSGRYSSRNPNFQNLPRDDKRIKYAIVSRPGKVFVGADYSQLEPRVFASTSKDPTLMDCFAKGEDFYSVVGIPIFGKNESSTFKKDTNAFATKYPELRNIAKAFALATPYGTSAFRQAQALNRPREECQDIIDKYFETYPKVELMMLEAHEEAKANGRTYSLYGRPRRIPEAQTITKIYGPTPHGELPYNIRTLLNLGMNHKVQSSAASIVNRAAIAFHAAIKELDINDCAMVLQVHDELVIECRKEDAEDVSAILKHCMENTTTLPGVSLLAEPKIGTNLADLK